MDPVDQVSISNYAAFANDPINKFDKDGDFVQALIGAVIGGGVEVVSQVATNMYSGKGMSFKQAIKKVDWVDVGTATVVGAVTGGTSALVGKGATLAATTVAKSKVGQKIVETGVKAVIAGTTNIGEEAVKAKTGDIKKDYTLTNVAIDGVVGGAFSVLGDVAAKPAGDLARKTSRGKQQVKELANNQRRTSNIANNKKSPRKAQVDRAKTAKEKHDNYGYGKNADAANQGAQKVTGEVTKKVLEPNQSK